MSEKLNIGELKQVLFAGKSVKSFNKDLADPATKLGIGSAAAEAAATSAACAVLAIAKTGSEDADMVKAGKDLEVLREYFIHLIDEENKAKMPLEKRLESGAPANEIEGGYRTACAIIDDVLFTAVKVVEILDSVADKLCPCTAAIASTAVVFARAAMDTVRLQLAYYSTKMSEEVYARTTKREPEMAIEGIAPTMDKLMEKFAKAL